MGITNQPPDLLPGTLDMLILQTLVTGDKHGYGIAERLKQVSQDVLQVGESSLYPALQRLLLNGWVKAEWGTSENNRRARYYTLTAAGREAVREWASSPARFPRIYHDAVVRLLAADLSDDATVLESLRGLREELAELGALLDEAERVAGSIPHRERNLRLVHSLGRRLVGAHEAWLDDVERELGQRG